MSYKGQKYVSYKYRQVQEVLAHHKADPSLSQRELAQIHGIRCSETVRYWIRRERLQKETVEAR